MDFPGHRQGCSSVGRRRNCVNSREYFRNVFVLKIIASFFPHVNLKLSETSNVRSKSTNICQSCCKSSIFPRCDRSTTTATWFAWDPKYHMITRILNSLHSWSSICKKYFPTNDLLTFDYTHALFLHLDCAWRIYKQKTVIFINVHCMQLFYARLLCVPCVNINCTLNCDISIIHFNKPCIYL